MREVRPRVVTRQVVEMVDSFAADEHRGARKHANKNVLDESGIWSLHALAAEIYGLGFQEGETVERDRQQGIRYRERDAEDASPEAAE